MRAELGRVAAALLLCAGCSSGGGEGGAPSPKPRAISPNTAFSGLSTPVTITGDDFLARPTGNGGALDTTHRAWLDGAELTGVTWIDSHTLRATVPAGLTAGAKALKVQNAYGETGSLTNAFTSAFKQLDPIPQFRATAKLSGFLQGVRI